MSVKALLSLFVLLATSTCYSASVLWDVFGMQRHEDAQGYTCYTLYCYGVEFGQYGYSPEMAFRDCGRFVNDPIYAGAILAESDGTGFLNAGNPYSYWVAATAGDVVSESYVLGKTAICDVEYVSPETQTSSFIIPDDEDFYIALLAGKRNARYSSDPMYCWLSLRIDDNGEILLVHSAASDTPGLVVGVGPWSAIPEPTSGSFVALGLAWLALRRRRNC